jgi:hydroxymethylpyrimidine/phosphomethylpyrimidine kinase
MQSVLSIAGSDPTGGAGIQADCQVLAAFGIHAAAVPTALTIQDGLRTRRVLPVFPSLVLEQLRATLDAGRPDAVKIGMLASDDVVRNVILALAPHGGIPVVIDPVLAASDGTLLLERRARPALHDLIQGRCLLTPNWPEAEILVDAKLPRRADGEAAARELLESHRLEAVLLKGGHLDGDASDLLVWRERGAAGGGREASEGGGRILREWLPGERIPGAPVHGTGCALSTAIAAGLAKGEPLRSAVDTARSYVREAIRRARTLPSGARVLAFR